MKLDDVIGHIRAADDIAFVIGAGASKSAGIPMAAELVKTINKDYAHCLGLLAEADRQDYGKAMGAQRTSLATCAPRNLLRRKKNAELPPGS